MGTNKRYAGYQSFDYLKTTRDFKEFALLASENAFEPYQVEPW